jgi:hypothetical protein
MLGLDLLATRVTPFVGPMAAAVDSRRICCRRVGIVKFHSLPTGSFSISVYPKGTKKTPVIGPASFKFGAGKTYIIYAIGSLSAKTLTVAVQTY